MTASARGQTGHAGLRAHTEAALTLAMGQGPAMWVHHLMLGSFVHAGSSLEGRRMVRSDRACELLGRVRMLALRRGRG